jgi:polyphenol oxidase
MQTQNKLNRALKTQDWHMLKRGSLTLLQSPLLAAQKDFVHAFTTRDGGSTPAPYHNFNLGRHIKDEHLKHDALANRELLCRELGVNHKQLRVPGQVHSGNVFVVREDEEPDLAGVDGLITDNHDLPLLLHFADCVPVIIFETEKRLVGIVHAGWRGTAQSIAVNAVNMMVEKWGARPGAMVAAVGPAIGPCCYPTGTDVVDQLMATVKASSEAVHELVDSSSEQPRPNLKAINAMQLLSAGVADVDVCGFCTACRPDLFFSHRQSGGVTGRQGALACLSIK